MSSDVPLTFNGPPQIVSRGGVLASEAFTPTDTAPSTLEDVLTLRTKADLVRAWRNGVAPEVPGQNGLEVYDGAILKRGILSPCTSVITHRLFGGGRWRGKTFEDGKGLNRFGGSRQNRFGLSSGDAKEIEHFIGEQVRYKKAALDPLMRELVESQEGFTVEEGQRRAEAARQAAIERRASANDDADEKRARRFEARIDTSQLDGQPALILDYGGGAAEDADVDATPRSAGDRLWGPVLGMRDEVREVTPGVLVGLGSFRTTGGVRNCAPFVLVRAHA